MNTYLKYFLYSGIFLLPFIAFVVIDDFFFPFITGKNFMFRILVEFLVGAWLVLAYRDSDYRIKITWPLLAVVSVVVVMAVSTLFSQDISKSFWSNYERMDGYVTLLHLFGYFLVLGSVLNSERLWKYFFHTTIVASIIMVVYGFFQLGGALEIHQGSTRLTGTLGNAAYMASYMMIHVFITAYYLLIHKGSSFTKFLYGIVIFSQLYILYYTATRGAILGLIGGVFIVALFTAIFERENKLLRKIAIGGIAGVVIFVAGFIAMKDSDFIQESRVMRRFAVISLDDNTTESRFLIWNMGFEAFKEKPILGWGYGNFTHVFNKFYLPEMYKNEPWFDRAHNIVFDWLVAGGILGLLAYMSIYLSSMYVLWFKKSVNIPVVGKSVITGLLAAYVFQNLFVFDNLVSYSLFFMVIAYIHTMSRENKLSDKFIEEYRNVDYGKRMENYAYPAGIGIVTIVMLFTFNYGPIAQNMALMKALRPSPYGPQANLDYYKIALEYGAMGTGETRERLTIQASQIASSPQVPQELRDQYLQLAITEMQRQALDIPEDSKYSLFLASLYNRTNQLANARETLLDGLKISPHKEQVIFELSLSYLNSGNYEEAYNIIKEVYDATPENAQAVKLYAVTAVYVGKTEEGDAALVKKFGEVIIEDQMLINAYAAVGNYERVLATWQLYVDNNPKNAQYRINLAASYMELEDLPNAITSLTKAKELDPKLTEQMDYYISELKEGRIPS